MYAKDSRLGHQPARVERARDDRRRAMLDKGMSERAAIIETDIPVRLDRLPWTGFHTLVVAALGITWILDGLEVTLAGSVAGALQESPVLHFSAAEVGAHRQRLSRGCGRRRAYCSAT